MTTLCNSCEFQDTCEIFEIMGDSMPITHCKNYIQTRRETARCKQTNADRIRMMSDKELARFFHRLLEAHEYSRCPFKVNDTCHLSKYGSCTYCAMDWLKKEVDDNEP